MNISRLCEIFAGQQTNRATSLSVMKSASRLVSTSPDHLMRDLVSKQRHKRTHFDFNTLPKRTRLKTGVARHR
jgi:hypothetical protein